MPVDIYLADHGLGVIMRCSGPISGTDLVNTHVAFINENEKALSAIRYWYSDHSEAEFANFSSNDIRRLSEIAVDLSQINMGVTLAICAPRNLIFGMSRMFGIYAEQTGWLIKIFREQEEAKIWLRETIQKDLTFE